MRRLLVTLLVAATASAATQPEPAARDDLDRVAAFARLFGVIRYFYPSDVAATIDWDRFAVLGVRQVRAARGAEALETALTALVGPLGPGITIGKTLPTAVPPGSADRPFVAWRYLGAGIGGPGPAGGPYAGKRTHRPRTASIDGFVTLMQAIPAASVRGRAIRLRGQVRAAPTDRSGSAALWLRVDRANQAPGFFDNMADRPVREPNWRDYEIDGLVADDATVVAFGMMASGAVVADFDALEVTVRDDAGNWQPVPIADAGFEAAAASPANWLRGGSSTRAVVTRPDDQAPQGRQYLRFSPAPAPSDEELFEEAIPVGGAHVDVDLGSGLKARVALALSETDAAAPPNGSPGLEQLRDAIAGISESGDDLDTRLADVVVAWNVFRHFYPYWTETGVQWDAQLRPQLARAAAATSRDGQRDALRELVADARDGHGSVADMRSREQRALLPIRLGLAGGQIVVTGSGAGVGIPVGAVVNSIDGTAADQRLAAVMRLTSGTTGWRQARALEEIAACPRAAETTLVVDQGSGPRAIRLRCEAMRPPNENRPAPIAELTAGVWYVDLTRAQAAQLTPALDALARATGVVFDLRGYPTDVGALILPHLIDTAERDRWMHVAKIVGPFGDSAGWRSFGWDLTPSAPRIAGKIVFLTDARAISYAESVMGYVADRKLGTIIGSTTAGTNGNIAMFTVPSGFTITFTGMRVTGHDGLAPHHLVGIKPDIPMTPTLAALREGRDELLERAVALIVPPSSERNR